VNGREEILKIIASTESPTRLHEVMSDVISNLDFQGGNALTGLASGQPDLDDMTRGLHNGDLIVIAGRPSSGKTALALNFAEHIAVAQNKSVAFFSLEMRRQDVALRLMSSRCRIDGQRLRKGMLSNAQVKCLMENAEVLFKAPLLIDDTPGLGFDDLADRAVGLKKNSSLQLLIVDSVNLMEPFADDAPYTRVARLCHSLKAMARTLDLPIVVTAQCSVPKEDLPKPRLTEIRESAALSEDADVVLLLHREEMRYSPGTTEFGDAKGYAELHVAKQRNGPTGRIDLFWQPEFTRFNPYSPNSAQSAGQGPQDAEDGATQGPF